MMRRPGRLIAVVAGGLVLVVAATVTYLLMPPRQTKDIALPAADATPEQVVTAYLEALNAHDCDTAEAVMAQDALRSWCRDVASLGNVLVGDHSIERPEHSGRSAPSEVAHVPVSFDLNWRAFHGDVSMEEGSTTWGYRLVRNSEEEPWRIVDQGVA